MFPRSILGPTFGPGLPIPMASRSSFTIYDFILLDHLVFLGNGYTFAYVNDIITIYNASL